MKVLVFGTFDLMHPGHLHFFKQARAHGDELYVVVARDQTIMDVKGKKPHYNEIERLCHVKAISAVFEAVLGSIDDKYDVIRRIKPDVICLGHDQEAFVSGLQSYLDNNCMRVKIERLKPYRRDVYRSSLLKEKLKAI